MHRSFIVFAAFVFFAGCTPKEEISKLQVENDSLRNVLASTQNMLFTFKEVNGLIDSIDASRNALRVDLVEGTPYNDYTVRLKEINVYVKRSEERINDLEKKLKSANYESEAYQSMIAALKDELSISMDEIKTMEDRVNKVMKENKNLNQTVKIQEGNLDDLQLQLEAKHEEVKLFAIQIQELTEKLQISEANANFAQAQALESAARKTRLAPKKKRETFREALGFYRKAHAAGHPDAAAKIKELEKKYNNL